MTDGEIVELYWKRNEQAIKESSQKYGAYCFSIANNILANCQDSEECVNDTWLRAWNAIPPQYPHHLSAFFAKITRNLSVNRYKLKATKKRGKDNVTVALEELEECTASSENVEKEFFQNEISDSISHFLYTLSKRDCNIFIRRYFYVQSIEEIAGHYHMKEAHVLVNLSRTRKKLRAHLQKEDYIP